MKPQPVKEERRKGFPWSVLGVFAVFLILRLGDIFRTLSKDEATWVMGAFNYHSFFDWLIHPPLGIGLISAWYDLVGMVGMRFLPLAFSVIVFVLLWWFLQRNMDEKTTFWSLLLYSVLHYAVIAGQLLDVDGAILASVYLLAIIFFFEGQKDSKWLWASGMVLGLSLWIRFTAPVLVVPLLLILFLDKKKIQWKEWAKLVVPIGASLILFVIFDQLVVGGEYLPHILAHNLTNSTLSYGAGLIGVLIGKAQALYLYQRRLIPAFLVLVGLGCWVAWREKNRFVRSLGIISIFFLLFWLIPSGGDKLRLFSSVLPVACMVAGFALREWNWKKEGAVVAGLAAIYLGFFYFGKLTEYETLETVVRLTGVKWLVLLGIPLLVGLVTKNWKWGVLVLVGGLLGCSLYYTAVSSMEKDTSLLSGYIESVHEPAMVNGDYGACVYKALENIPCIVQSESGEGYQYVRYVLNGDRIDQEIFFDEADSTQRVMQEYGLTNYFFTQKVFRTTPMPELMDCEETELEATGRTVGWHFTCASN